MEFAIDTSECAEADCNALALTRHDLPGRAQPILATPCPAQPVPVRETLLHYEGLCKIFRKGPRLTTMARGPNRVFGESGEKGPYGRKAPNRPSERSGGGPARVAAPMGRNELYGAGNGRRGLVGA